MLLHLGLLHSSPKDSTIKQNLRVLTALEPLFKFLYTSLFKFFSCPLKFPGKSKWLQKFKHRCGPQNLLAESFAVVKNSYFLQNSRFTKIIRHLILIQTLLLLMRLPTRQDGFQNRDKVFTSSCLAAQISHHHCLEFHSRVVFRPN